MWPHPLVPTLQPPTQGSEEAWVLGLGISDTCKERGGVSDTGALSTASVLCWPAGERRGVLLVLLGGREAECKFQWRRPSLGRGAGRGGAGMGQGGAGQLSAGAVLMRRRLLVRELWALLGAGDRGIGRVQ